MSELDVVYYATVKSVQKNLNENKPEVAIYLSDEDHCFGGTIRLSRDIDVQLGTNLTVVVTQHPASFAKKRPSK